MVKKSTPKGIDPAYPNRNFVKTCYVNHDDMSGFYDYMYGTPEGNFGVGGQGTTRKKSNVHGYGVGQRAGKLRYSGASNAHRIGKRSK